MSEYQPEFGIEHSIKQADEALYHGKRHGKNRVVLPDDIETKNQ